MTLGSSGARRRARSANGLAAAAWPSIEQHPGQIVERGHLVGLGRDHPGQELARRRGAAGREMQIS